MSEVALAACPCDPGLPPQAGGSDGTISDNTTPVLSVIRKIDVQPRVIFWWSPEPGIPTLGIFGRINPRYWTPPGMPIHRTVCPDPKAGLSRNQTAELITTVAQETVCAEAFALLGA